jgi:acyl-CoA synthetase (AMP-forming)/AMP-acid ligase II
MDVPDVGLAEFVLARAEELGDKPALIDGPSGRTLTYAQLAHTTRAIAAGLAARDFGPGDVFGIFSPNLPEYAAAFHGVAASGGASTTINSLASVEDAAAQLAATRARFLLTVAPFMDRALPAAKEAGVEEVFVLGEADEGTPFTALVGDPAAAPAHGIDHAETVVAMPMSSGTTGFPKVVQLTHRNLVANVIQSSAAIELEERDVMIGVLPFFHVYGLTVLMNLALWRGTTVVTMPRFELEAFLRLMQDHGVTYACLVPPIVLALAKHASVGAHDLAALEFVISGAAPLDAGVGQAAAARLGCTVLQGYGLTEASPVLSAPVRDPSRGRPDSTGLILPDTEIRIEPLDEGDGDPSAGADGEIWARGPQVMKGYLDDPDANAWIFPGDGWLRTGDIGHCDEDGYLYVVDRLKELIKYRGYQVPPAELEALLLQHPEVADAAVVPAPDPNAGEIPKAFVVRTEGATVTEGQLMSYVSERVPSYKKVRRCEFVDEIPRSLSGKILRRVLVERERAAG